MGVATAIKFAMQKHGLTHEQACLRFWVFDHAGLVTAARDAHQLAPEIRAFARPELELADCTLLEVVHAVKPSALLGLTGAGRVWGDDVLTAMGRIRVSSHPRTPALLSLSLLWLPLLFEDDVAADVVVFVGGCCCCCCCDYCDYCCSC